MALHRIPHAALRRPCVPLPCPAGEVSCRGGALGRCVRGCVGGGAAPVVDL